MVSDTAYGIWETKNLSTDPDSGTDIFVSAGVKKGADSYFFCPPPQKKKIKFEKPWLIYLVFWPPGSWLENCISGHTLLIDPNPLSWDPRSAIQCSFLVAALKTPMRKKH